MTVEHPSTGALELVRTAPRFEGAEAAPAPSPLLGEHTREVLLEAGLDEAEIEGIAAASR